MISFLPRCDIFLNTLYMLDSTLPKSAIKTKANKIRPEKGFLQHFKGSLYIFLEDFIYNIFKTSNKKFNTKKVKGGGEVFRNTLYIISKTNIKPNIKKYKA